MDLTTFDMVEIRSKKSMHMFIYSKIYFISTAAHKKYNNIAFSIMLKKNNYTFTKLIFK